MGPVRCWPRSSKIRCRRIAAASICTAIRSITACAITSLISWSAAARILRLKCRTTIRATCRWCGSAGLNLPSCQRRRWWTPPRRRRLRVNTQDGRRVNETIRPHRKAARHQAREGLELEIHLREDRRLFGGADRRRDPRADEIDKTAGRECWRAFRPLQERNRDAERDA